jgi:hypothetical protein
VVFGGHLSAQAVFRLDRKSPAIRTCGELPTLAVTLKNASRQISMDYKKVNIFYILIPIILLIGLMITSIIDYPVIFDKSKWTVITVFIAIIGYIVLWIYLKPDRFSYTGGLIIGLLFIINISIEEFINWQTKTGSIVSTLLMMFLIFISFSIISAIKTFKTKNIINGLISSFISALLGTVIALCFGFLINYVFSERMIFTLKGYPGYNDFINPKAFTFYNAFDNASNHVIIAPIISIIMGLLGGLTVLIILRLRKRKTNMK